MIQENPRIDEDTDLDLNNVELLLYIKLTFKMLKLIAAIFTMSYFLGQFWYIKCQLELIYKASNFYKLSNLEVDEAE